MKPPGINIMIKYVHWNKEFLHNFAYKTWEFNTYQRIEYSIATLEYRLKDTLSTIYNLKCELDIHG